MNGDEFEIVMRMVSGHWPNPAMGSDETTMWRRTLLPLNFDAACDVLDLISSSGKTFRPNDGEFTAEYRMHLKMHPLKIVPVEPPQIGGPRSFCGHSLNAVACPEAVEYWANKCREQINELVGPLANGLTVNRSTSRR